jgi:hypothetical protein
VAENRWGTLASSHSSAVDCVRRVAESNDSTGVDAAELLVTDANGGGMVAVTPTPRNGKRRFQR